MTHDIVKTRVILRSGQPIPGQEIAYFLAWKHRDRALRLHNDTPFWQVKKKRRRFEAYLRSISRFHLHGRDLVLS